jgi:hypothetical protein
MEPTEEAQPQINARIGTRPQKLCHKKGAEDTSASMSIREEL